MNINILIPERSFYLVIPYTLTLVILSNKRDEVISEVFSVREHKEVTSDFGGDQTIL